MLGGWGSGLMFWNPDLGPPGSELGREVWGKESGRGRGGRVSELPGGGGNSGKGCANPPAAPWSRSSRGCQILRRGFGDRHPREADAGAWRPGQSKIVGMARQQHALFRQRRSLNMMASFPIELHGRPWGVRAAHTGELVHAK